MLHFELTDDIISPETARLVQREVEKIEGKGAVVGAEVDLGIVEGEEVDQDRETEAAGTAIVLVTAVEGTEVVIGGIEAVTGTVRTGKFFLLQVLWFLRIVLNNFSACLAAGATRTLRGIAGNVQKAKKRIRGSNFPWIQSLGRLVAICSSCKDEITFPH